MDSEKMNDLIEKTIKKTEDEIKELNSQIKELEEKKQQLRSENNEERCKLFQQTYNKSANDVLREYHNLLQSCCYQGGKGYRIWFYYDENDSPCRWVVKPEMYERAKPCQMELDAYKAVYGKDMKITTETHIERWGN